MSRDKKELEAIDIARKNVITCSPCETIPKIAQMMIDNWIGSVIVIENEEPVGIVTDGIIFNLIAKEMNPLCLLARDVMHSPVFTVNEHQPIVEILEKFREIHVKRVAVVNSSGKVVGVLSNKDVDQYTRYSLAQRILSKRSTSC